MGNSLCRNLSWVLSKKRNSQLPLGAVRSMASRARRKRFNLIDALTWNSDLSISFALSRKSSKQRIPRSGLSSDDINVAVANPDMGFEIPLAQRSAVVQHGRYAAPPKHKLRRKTLLNAQGTPGHPPRSRDNRPPDLPSHEIASFMGGRQLPHWKSCQKTKVTKGHNGYNQSCDCQPNYRLG
jgi:hypothetical protein